MCSSDLKIAKYAGLPLGLILLLEIAHWMFRTPAGAAIANGAGAPGLAAPTAQLSLDLFQKYLFPFEATSILILIAILGALVLARKEE